MESYLVLSILALGVLAGGSVTWLYWQRRMELVKVQMEETAESTRKSIGQMVEKHRQLDEEIFAGQKEIERLKGELAVSGGRLAELADELRDSHRQFRELTGELRESEQRGHRLGMELVKIPELEKKLAVKEDELADLNRIREELLAEQEELTARLAEEKRSLDESLIFVEGSHYLPGRVVRNLIETQKYKESGR